MSTQTIVILMSLYFTIAFLRGMSLDLNDGDMESTAFNISRGLFWPIDAIKVFVRAFWRTVSKW